MTDAPSNLTHPIIPEDGFSIDFETYYDKEYSLKKMSTFEYVNDPRFDAYMVAIHSFSGVKWAGHPKDFDWHSIAGKQWRSHNAGFDECVYNRLQELGIVPKDANPSRWDCTADLAAYLNVPRNLKDSTRILLGMEMDKSVREGMVGRKWQDLSETEKSGLTDYACTDAVGCSFLWVKCSHLWPEMEQILSRENRHMGFTGFRVDEELLRATLDAVVIRKFEAEGHIPWDWDGAKTPLSPTKIREQCRVLNITCPSSFAKDDPECMEWEETYGDVHPWIGAVRDWRRLNMIHAKLETLKHGLKNGRFPFALKYFGAHSGRFSGSEKFNMQNMPKDPSKMFGVDLRGMFLADEGEELITVDLAQIEARMLLWFVGDNVTLDMIRSGYGIYEAHAVSTMGYLGEKGSLKKANPALYSLAKARCLAGDTLVLTKDRGYVTISQVTLKDMVWDGVEWVNHEGVICNGQKETISIRGERFTTDHLIFTDENTTRQVGAFSEGGASANLYRRDCTDNQGAEIRRLASAVKQVYSEIGSTLLGRVLSLFGVQG